MAHQWVKNLNRVSPEYVAGIKEFLNVAKQRLNSRGLTLCPCVKCVNIRLQSINVIRAHLISVGIDGSNTRWVYHGEEGVVNKDFVNDEFDGMRAGLHDAVGDQFFNIRPTNDFLCDLWTEKTYLERAQKNADSRGK